MQTKHSTDQAPEVRPVEQVVVELTVDLVVEESAAPGSAVVSVSKEAATLVEKILSLNPKQKTTVILEEEV
ncbi:hypothetical protein ACFXTH_032638 [Malus domestica]